MIERLKKVMAELAAVSVKLEEGLVTEEEARDHAVDVMQQQLLSAEVDAALGHVTPPPQPPIDPNWRDEWTPDARRRAIDRQTPMWVVDLLDQAHRAR